MSNTFSTKVSGKVSSRGWAIALGLGAIVLATILLIVYLDRYRARVGGATAPTPGARSPTARSRPGRPARSSPSRGCTQPTTLPKKEVLEGAIADPTFLTGRAAAVDILPGKQLTALDFAASTTTTVDSQITGAERAISVSLDAVHGSLSQLKAGDDIDIYIGTSKPALPDEPIVTLFRPDIKVLAVPTPEGGNLVLRIHTRDAAKFAYAADHTRLWFVLRPAAPGDKRTPDSTAHPREPQGEADPVEGVTVPSRPVKALLAIEPGVDAEQVQESLPDDPEFDIVAVATSADDTIQLADGYAGRRPPRRLRGVLGPGAAPARVGGAAQPGPARDGARPRVAERLPAPGVRGGRGRHRDAPRDAATRCASRSRS